MQLVKLIILKRIKTLHCFYLTILVTFFTLATPAFSQDNSPYSRYGIGDLVPNTNINTRAMGGISAGFSDYLSINFNNPASYTAFQAIKEQKSKKLLYGRAILDIGVNVEGRTLREPSPARKFTANNALFSYVQIGVPLKKNWGLSIGLRPVSRISYNIISNERLKDPLTGLPIDSAQTNFQGTGGSYLASIGTGITLFSRRRNDKDSLEEKLSIGVNTGYFFGQKDYSSRRSFLNDSVEYYQANYQTKTSFGNMYFNVGMQYQLPLNKKTILTVGAFGTLGQKIDATQDRLIETFIYDATLGNLRLDSIADNRDVKGKIQLPASYTFGFTVQKFAIPTKEGGYVFGADFTQQSWNGYRFLGQRDSLRNSWNLKLGAQLNPVPRYGRYFSNVSYRFGFNFGPDYIKVQKNLPAWGASFGIGLPLRQSRQAANQATLINLALEYGKRGNKDNLLRESTFRVSLGLSLSDFWFAKKKYD